MISNDKITLIADIGINANGDMLLVKKLIDATHACGWDFVKFQKRNPDKCVPEKEKNKLKETPWGTMTYLDYKKKMEFSYYDYSVIDLYCSFKPIQWSVSVWDLDSVEFIKQFPNRPFIKIPSAKLTDFELLEAVCELDTTVILSTGMSTWEQVKGAVYFVDSRTNDYVIMHCNSAYPAPTGDLNLKMIQTLSEEFKGVKIGYSGHEHDLEPTVAAAVLGATVIERHITIDHTMWGTDQAASLEVQAMNILRKRIGDVIESLGDGVKKITSLEQKVMKKLRGVNN